MITHPLKIKKKKRYRVYKKRKTMETGLMTPPTFQEKPKEWFQNILENAPVMVWMTDANNDFNYFNQSWLKFTGKELKEELGDRWLGNVHPEDKEFCQETISKAFKNYFTFEAEFRLLRNDGVYRWVLIFAKPQYSPGESFNGFIGSCVDVTRYRNR